MIEMDKIYVVRRYHPEHRDNDQCRYSETEAEELKQEYITDGYLNADYDSYTQAEFFQMSILKTCLEDGQKYDQYLLNKYKCPIYGEVSIQNTPDETLIVSKRGNETEQFEMKVTREELLRWYFLKAAWKNRDNPEWFEQFHF